MYTSQLAAAFLEIFKYLEAMDILMVKKTLGEKIDDLSTRLLVLETEFRIFKRMGYIILTGIGGILLKLYWQYILASPIIIANVIHLLK